MLKVKRRELEKMYKTHYQVYLEANAEESSLNYSHYLLLFYAIECGLKALIIKREVRKNTTDALFKHKEYGEKLRQDGHDIKYMLKILNNNSYRKLRTLQCKNFQGAPPKEYNQVWRYGIETEKEIESEIVEELEKIANWIKEAG